MDANRRIVVNDYAGHPFQIELAAKLADLGHDVSLLYCSTNVTPHGDLERSNPGLTVVPISTGATFDKYALLKRTWQELRYGFTSARAQRRFGADVILTSNVPVLAVLVMRLLNRSTRQVLWLQDIQAGLAAMALTGPKRLLVGLFDYLERLSISSADHVVAIAPSLAEAVTERGIDVEMEVIENWAPLGDLPVRPRTNEWAVEHDLDDKFVFLYSGTLGIKHRPELLSGLAEQYRDDPDVRVVVVSQGKGMNQLKEKQKSEGLDNLVLLPFQPFEALPDVMGSADVLIAVLEQEAGSFSIPSKILSYLCSGRPVLASLPAENSSSDLVANRAEAGLVSTDEAEFMAQADQLRSDPTLCKQLGENGRLYAETTFDIDRISKMFLAALTGEEQPPRQREAS
jgi:glycosyltransferase involved in cell wall biosynthesis